MSFNIANCFLYPKIPVRWTYLLLIIWIALSQSSSGQEIDSIRENSLVYDDFRSKTQPPHHFKDSYATNNFAPEQITKAFSSDSDILEPPVFSHMGGFYQDRFHLELWHPEIDVLIVYTLDGSEPLIENLSGKTYGYKNQYAFYPDSPLGEILEEQFRSNEYNGAISVHDRSQEDDKFSKISSTVHDPDYLPEKPVFKGTVIRARAYKEGKAPSEIVTHTYFVAKRGRNRYSLPVISLAIQEDYLFDYTKGIYTAGIVADQWRKNNPDKVFSWGFAGNFLRRGVEWEYPGNIEFFEKHQPVCAVNQLLGVRIHGGGSRSFPMKSLRLYARNEYGASQFGYSFFGENQSAGYKRLLLRNSGNDFPTKVWAPENTSRTMIRDAFIQTLVKDLHFETQAYSPVIVFINGEYWGIHNLRERFDKHYFSRVYNIEESELDLLTGQGSASEGDYLHYRETLNFIRENTLEADSNYQYILTRIDEKNFTDYQIANIYIRNTDWPGNNIDFWRYRAEEYNAESPAGKDGRWRWVLYDTDFAYGLADGSIAVSHNTLKFATQAGGTGWPNPDWSTFLLREFLKNQDFRTAFINRFADLLNTVFLPEHSIEVINTMKNNIAPEMEEHFHRWAPWESYSLWEQHVGVMIEFALKRPEIQRQHIAEFFDLDGMIEVTADISHPLHGYIRVNTIDVLPSTAGVGENPYPWEGTYFKGIPLEIEAVPAPGYRFSHWEGFSESTENVLTIDPEGDVFLKANFVTTNEEHLLFYWFFDDSLPNDQPIEKIPASFGLNSGAKIEFISCLPGYPYNATHAWWRNASMERRNQPTALNYIPEVNDNLSFEDSGIRGLQIRQPMIYNNQKSTLIFHLPTKGKKDLMFKFAAINEGAAENLVIDYSTDEEINWISKGLENTVFKLTEFYNVYEIDFKEINAVNSNPHFRIRIRFEGNGAERWEADRVTFNNVSLHGRTCMTYRLLAISDSLGVIKPDGSMTLFACEKRKFILTPIEDHVIRDLTLDGVSVLDQVVIRRDKSGVFVLNESVGEELIATFKYDDRFDYTTDSILIYPIPARDILYIESKEQIASVTMYDISGRQVYSVYPGSRYVDINIQGLNPGIYFLMVKRGNTLNTKKIIVVKE